MVTMSWIKNNKSDWNIKVIKDGVEDIVKPIDVMGKYGTDAEALEAFKNVLKQATVIDMSQQPAQLVQQEKQTVEQVDLEQGRQM